MVHMLKIIGQNLTRIRLEKHLTRQDFSALLGVPERELKNIENGISDLDANFIYKASAMLQVSLNDLVGTAVSRDKLLDHVLFNLKTCSESDLILVLEYIENIVKRQR